MQAILAFEDGGSWQRRLDHLADEELPLQCPACSADLLVGLEEEPYVIVDFEDDGIEPTPVEPTKPAKVSLGRRMITATENAGQDRVAEILRYAMGHGTCPHCGAGFQIADVFA